MSSKALRVLLVEESEDDAFLILRALRAAGLEVESSRVQTHPTMDAALSDREWDVVLSDHVLPDFGSDQALDLLQAKNLDVPLIIVSGAIGEEAAVAVIHRGAVDYVGKRRLDRLAPAVRASVLKAAARRAQRAAEAALGEAEEQFRTAFERSPIGMALATLSGTLTMVNDALCQLIGYPKAELEGLGVETLAHSDERHDVVDGLLLIQRGEQSSYAAETRLLHAAGPQVWAFLQLTLIRGSDGVPLRLLAQLQDITDQKRYEDRLADLADHDPLTGLLNRRSFGRRLESHAALAGRYGAEGALLMLDLDHFKYVNDTLGHQAGDDVIVRVAAVLESRLRQTDLLARLGGDEFAILLPKGDADAALHVAGELLGALREEPVTITGIPMGAITASIGITTFEPTLTGEDVLVHADLAMYDAKEAGRDCIATFATEEHEQARMKGRLSWVQKIRVALEHDRFSLVAQPIVRLATGEIAHHELLLRMRDDDGELIEPGAFLYIAERLDLIQQIDAWVVRNALRLLAAHAERRSILAVNLSARSLDDPEVLELIEHELRRASFPPERLIIEVTETAAIEQISRARRFSQHLAELGCRLALDDFGAGFGSFYYLKHLSFDYLKIDGEFIQHCTSNKTDRLVVEAIVNIARGLGKRTIAEFVGDDDTARLLARLGVGYGQGYHFGLPAPVSELFGSVGAAASSRSGDDR